MNSKYSWLLFDLDDTLLDYNETERHALISAFEAQNIELTDDHRESYRVINKSLWNRLESGELEVDDIRTRRFELLADEASLSIDAGRMSEDYLDAFSSRHFVTEGAVELLQECAEKVNMALVTNGIRQTQLRRMRETGLDNYFSHIVTSEDAGAAKPDVRFFEYLVSRIDFYDKSRMLIIGDNLSSDILGGINFGIDSCWYNPFGKEADAVQPTFQIGTLWELSAIV